MGELARFYGMVIWMYSGDHDPPHLHILHSGKVSRISLEGEIIENYLPARKLKILKKWMEQHKEELDSNWERRKSGRKIIKIKPWSKNED